MKQILFFLSNLIFILPLTAQDVRWKAFWNNDTTLLGFKDQNGNVKIEPKFSGFTTAQTLEHIAAVSEDKNGRWESYYLTTAGKTTGRDSLYIFDNTPDCESEGFIRFRDRQRDLAGMFDRNGNIAIPALYNDLSPVRNGMVVALKGAKKEVLEGGEHFRYNGGSILLIDTGNRILLDSFVFDDNLNLYSLEISSKPSSGPIRTNFKAGDGRYFSFIDFDKEFRFWLKSSFLTNLSKQNLLNTAYDEIAYWNETRGWIIEKSNVFINRNYAVIRKKLAQLNLNDSEFDITTDGLNPFIYRTEQYATFFNNCGESLDWIYPIKTIIINDPEMHDLTQDHFEFLRTAKGYKLISVTLGNGGLK